MFGDDEWMCSVSAYILVYLYVCIFRILVFVCAVVFVMIGACFFVSCSYCVRSYCSAFNCFVFAYNVVSR